MKSMTTRHTISGIHIANSPLTYVHTHSQFTLSHRHVHIYPYPHNPHLIPIHLHTLTHAHIYSHECACSSPPTYTCISAHLFTHKAGGLEPSSLCPNHASWGPSPGSLLPLPSPLVNPGPQLCQSTINQGPASSGPPPFLTKVGDQPQA